MNPRSKAGARKTLAGDTENPTPKPTDPQPDTIATLRSWEPESKLELRRKLNEIALLAENRAKRARSPDAVVQLWHIALVAGRWVLASADEETLADMHAGLIRAGLAANAFERNGSGLDA